MSLINRMLQDLEHRSVGNPVPNGIHGQIRAVPLQKGIHPAWWVVLALALCLAAALAWFLTRPQPQPPVSPNLALKIAPQLGAMPSPVAQEPLPLDTAPPPPIQRSAPVAAPSGTSPAAAEPVRDLQHEATHDVVRESAVAQPESKLQAPLKPRAEQGGASPKTDDAKPANLTKQFNELTPAQRAENAYREAALQIQAGKSAEAMALLEQALKLDPRHAGARQTLIGLLLQAKRNDDALRLTQEGLAQDPAQTGLTMILARVQLDQGDVHAAIATMERGLPYAGPNAEYHAFMAALLIRDKRNKDAIDQYTVALTAEPQNGVWWMGLGMALQADNHLPDAREAYLRAKRSNTLTPELQAFVEQKIGQLPKP